jgi:hypothetical protein
MFSISDTSGVAGYVSGKPLSPHNSCDNFDPNATSDAGFDAPSSLDFNKLLEDKTIARRRWADGTFDARDELVGVWKGVRTKTEVIGRSWRFDNGQFHPRIDEGLGWGNTSTAVIPAVAALATHEVDKGSLTAWGNLHQILAVPGAPGPIDRELTAALNRSQGAEVNTVRFVHRLAAMYWHALALDHTGPALVELRRPATAEPLMMVGKLQTNLIDASGGKQFIPWHEAGSIDSASVYRVLYAAASGSLVGMGGQTTRFLKMWPSLGAHVEVITDNVGTAQALRAMHTATLSAREVWYVAVRWIARYSDLTLWDEALAFVGSFAASPTPRQFTTLDSRVAYCLPKASMGAFALGPLLQPNLDTGLGDAMAEPKHGLLVERACVAGLLTSLMFWHMMWKIVGWYSFYDMCNDDDAAEYWRRFLRTTHVAGVWRAINANVGNWVPGSVGRIWGTVMATSPSRWKRLPKLQNLAPQWDEIVARCDKVMADSAVYGQLYPLRPTRDTFPRMHWVAVGSIPNARAMEHAYYSVLDCNPVTIIRINDPGSGTQTIAHKKIVNYRGVEADYSVLSGVNRDGHTFCPVFMVTDKDNYSQLISEDSLRYELRWFIEAPLDSNVTPRPLVDLSPTIPAPHFPPPAPSDSGSEDDSILDSNAQDEESKDDDTDDDPPPPLHPDPSEDPMDTAAIAALEAQLHIARVGSPKDVPLGDFQIAGAFSSLEKLLGPGDPILLAIAHMVVNGAPTISQASLFFDRILEADHFETLTKIDKTKRAFYCERMYTLYRNMLTTIPPGNSTVIMARRAAGLKSMEAAMRSCPALRGEELRDCLSGKLLRQYGLAEQVDLGQGRTRLEYNFEGKLPPPAAIHALINGGYTILDGIGSQSTVSHGGVLADTAPPPQDTVADLCRVILDSAVEAGEPASVDMIIDIIGDAATATAVFEAYQAANAIIGSSTPHTEEAKNCSGEVSGTSALSSMTTDAPSIVGGLDAGVEAQSPTSSHAALSGTDVGVRAGSEAALARIRARSGSLTGQGNISPRPSQRDLGHGVEHTTQETSPTVIVSTAPTATGDTERGTSTSQSGVPRRADSSSITEAPGIEETVVATFVDPLSSDSGTRH